MNHAGSYGWVLHSGVRRGGASVGAEGLQPPALRSLPRNSIGAPTSPPYNLRRKKEGRGDGRRRKNKRASLELNHTSATRCVLAHCSVAIRGCLP